MANLKSIWRRGIDRHRQLWRDYKPPLASTYFLILLVVGLVAFRALSLNGLAELYKINPLISDRAGSISAISNEQGKSLSFEGMAVKPKKEGSDDKKSNSAQSPTSVQGGQTNGQQTPPVGGGGSGGTGGQGTAPVGQVKIIAVSQSAPKGLLLLAFNITVSVDYEGVDWSAIQISCDSTYINCPISWTRMDDTGSRPVQFTGSGSFLLACSGSSKYTLTASVGSISDSETPSMSCSNSYGEQYD